MAITFRRATAADAAQVATVYIASRRGAAAYLPTVGTDAEIRAFVIHQMVPERETWVAEDAGRMVAVLTIHDDEVDQFYVAPGDQRRGIGDAMLAHAKRLRPAGLQLWAFQRNAPARRFYEARGFIAKKFTDGATNMEREADVLYQWTPSNDPKFRQGADAMAKIDLNKVPRFAELPIKPDKPKESSWGVFGDDDELGCLNFLTPQGVIDAARLVRKGSIFRLDTKINYANPPLFARRPAKHNIMSFESFGLLGFDDSLDSYNTQEGSQWDGLAHVGSPRYKLFYNGVKSTEIKDGPAGRLSIHKWANKFVGRAVLLDAFRYRISHGRTIDPLKSEKYSLDDLKETAIADGVELKPGTILLIRTGWMQAYLAASPADKAAMAPLEGLKACGIEDSSAMVEWFWDHRVAAVGTDCPAVEPWPWDFKNEGALHYRTLCLLGLPIGEQFNLEELAADCAADKRYEFMLVSVPMNLEGGIASPPNAVAIK